MKKEPAEGFNGSRRRFLGGSVALATQLLALETPLGRGLARASTPGARGNRVVWIRDPNCLSWGGSGYYGDAVVQQRVSDMLDRAMLELTGTSAVADAWRVVIPDYVVGKKIGVKVNFNNAPSSTANIDAMAPPINAVIGGLKSMGVRDSDIYIIDPSREFPTVVGDRILAGYPNVFLCGGGSNYNRGFFSYVSADPTLTVNHSHPSLTDRKLPDQFAQFSYFINMPIMKGHWACGVTFAFKNYVGMGHYADIAQYHPYFRVRDGTTNYSYDRNPVHDIYLNSHIRDKTVLIIADALFGQRVVNAGLPERWTTFGNDYPKSILVATDPVAIDSVLFDISSAEYDIPIEAQLYLHRAAELGLGFHEHWNNAREKRYSTIDFRKIGVGLSAPQNFRFSDPG